jgi:Ca-activated chloride channel homolog
MSMPSSGLYAGQHAIPLEHVEIYGCVRGLCSAMRVSQRYRNAESRDVEAVYIFPLSEGAAIHGFKARVGDRVIEGEIEERERAFARYDDAMAEGHGAFLLEQERPNVFTASVGNLRPGESVEITIEYVAFLNLEGDAVRLLLPTTVAPRYVPPGPPEIGQPAGERVNAEARDSVPYGLGLRIDVSGVGPLRTIESPSHPVRVTLEGEGAIVSLTTDTVALDRDFILHIEPREPHAPRALVAREEDGTRVAVVTFFPELDHEGVPESEVVFVLDCSGSMGGDSIVQAKNALGECIRTLAPSDTFDVVCFGSQHRSLWPEAHLVTSSSLDEALAFLSRVDANMGGTEILAPLQFVFSRALAAGRRRQVLLLTDGQVSNEDHVIALCAAQRDTRVFAFGIGSAASEHLVREVGRVTNGAAEFIAPGERIEPKVARMFTRVHAPATPVEIDWDGMEVEQEPAVCPPLFSGDSLTVLARIKSGGAESVGLRAAGQEWRVPLDLDGADRDGPIPLLWARERIRSLERERSGSRGSQQRPEKRRASTEAQIVELAKRYRLMSSQTSFVAVEVRSAAERSKLPPVLRRVPVAAPAGMNGASRRPSLALGMSETLLESELFGYEKGSFTGQNCVRAGLFEVAQGGTLFLNGIDQTSHAIQAKLLKVLERGEVQRLGCRNAITLDVRVVLAMKGDPATALIPALYRILAGNVVVLPPPKEGRSVAELLAVDPANAKLDASEVSFLGTLQQLATGRAPVLIVGEGPDAKAVARTLHERSHCKGRFVEEDLGGPGPQVPAPPLPGGEGLNERQRKLLEYLRSYGSIRAKDYSDIMQISESTGGRDLRELVRRGLIQSVGKGSGATYTLAGATQAG